METITPYICYYSTDTGLNFQCGDMHCWQIKDGYQTARKIDGCCYDHQKFKCLEDALLRLRRYKNADTV